MTIVVRTHGGLGNQLFQVLYARLRTTGAGDEPVIVHDDRYAHRFGLSPIFTAGHPGSAARALSAMRLPKVASRVAGREIGVVALPGLTLLDGYFQDRTLYSPFAPMRIADELARLRAALGITPAAPTGPALHHIRLGDFFDDPARENAYLRERLGALPVGGAIMTNREALLTRTDTAPLLAERALTLVPSGAMTPEDVLRTMAGYATVHSNDSTLALWGALLGRRELRLESERLRALHATLASADRSAQA